MLGNGLTESYQYNARLRLLGGSIGTAYSFWVGYANDGVVTSSQDTVNGNWTYTYDNFNRLATAVESNQLEAAYNYQYDRFGNRWQQNLTAGSGYNSLWSFSDYNNQISSDVTYDAAGNIISDDANAYTYDAENRIISLTNSYGTYTYNYDALGHRVQKTVGGVGLNYLYDLAGREVTRVDTQAAWVSGEVYAGAQHLATYGGSTTTFDHADWLGTERYRTTAAGGFAESCQSLVFGDGYSCTGGDMSPLHFMGKEHDAESNLENFGARYYNSRYGRFVTPDWSAVPAPIPYADLTNPQSLNQYVIVRDDPGSFADLDGHEPGTNEGCTAREGAQKSCTGGFVDTTGSCNGTGTTNCSTPQLALQAAQKDPPDSQDVLGDALIGMVAGGVTSSIKAGVSFLEGFLDTGGQDVAGASAGGTQGVVAQNGTNVSGFTSHGINRAIGDGAERAGTKPEAILDALKNPKQIVSGVDQQGRPFQIFTGQNARVIINPQSGQVVSVNPLSGAGAQ